MKHLNFDHNQSSYQLEVYRLQLVVVAPVMVVQHHCVLRIVSNLLNVNLKIDIFWRRWFYEYYCTKNC